MKQIPIRFVARFQAVLRRSFFAGIPERRLIGWLGMVLLLTGNVSGQESLSNVVDSLNNISKKTRKIRENHPNNRSIVSRAIQIESKIREVATAFRLARSSDFSKSYYNSIKIYDESLAPYAESAPDQPQNLIAILNNLHEDLISKAAFASSGRGGRTTDVSVIVRTVRNGADDSGYIVWYVRKAWRDSEAHYMRFDRLSTPSVMDLPPGNYFIWAEKGQRVSEKQPLSLGNDKRSRREIDIVVH